MNAFLIADWLEHDEKSFPCTCFPSSATETLEEKDKVTTIQFERHLYWISYPKKHEPVKCEEEKLQDISDLQEEEEEETIKLDDKKPATPPYPPAA